MHALRESQIERKKKCEKDGLTKYMRECLYTWVCERERERERGREGGRRESGVESPRQRITEKERKSFLCCIDGRV